MTTTTAAATPQPPPTTGTGPSVHDLVVADMLARKAMGERKYGTHLRAWNGRESLVDLEQELLDGAAYCRQALVERDGLIAVLRAASHLVAEWRRGGGATGMDERLRELDEAVARCAP